MKNLILKYTFFSLLIFITICCSDEFVKENFENRSNKAAEASNSRSIEDAINEANEFINRLDEFKSSTRSKSPRLIKDIQYIKASIGTRGVVPDTLMYLINYSDEMGFALIGKSKASKGIYAISTEGSLSMEDTIDNKGLALFINAAYEDAINTQSIIGPPVPEFVYKETKKVAPLLHPNIAKWHQNEPYNKYNPIHESGLKIVGCGPVATGMLMAHYRWPEHIGDMNINWNELIEMDDSDKVARFLDILGSKEYLCAEYFKLNTLIAPGVMETSIYRQTSPERLNSVFGKCGFQYANAWVSDSLKMILPAVFNYMQNGHPNGDPPAPVMLSAPGHVWIADGFIERMKKNKIAISLPESPWLPADPYIHCIWGWGSKSNGYYLYFTDSDCINDKSKTGVEINNKYSKVTVIGRFSK